MEREIVNEETLFEVISRVRDQDKKLAVISKKRSLIGRGQACDIVLPFFDVSSIHAVLEFDGKNSFKIFDLNSKNGTWVNKNKIIFEDINPGDEIYIGHQKILIRPYRKKKTALPPVLNILDDEIPPLRERNGIVRKKILPKSPQNISYPRVEYPLAKDPRAEFSEYIFEDEDNIYPIFKYNMDKVSVEIIIVFNDKIQSVDYIPSENGSYYLVGSGQGGHNISYPYLGKNEKFLFVKMLNETAEVFTPSGYSAKSVGKRDDRSGGSFILGDDEIIQFTNQHIQIFVRSTQRPPRVASAPILRRDKDLRKYIFLMFFLVLSFLIPVSLFHVNEDLDKEKAPERIATILYNRKIRLPKFKALDKTKDAPKKVAQKSPKKEPPKKVVKEKKQNKLKKVEKKVKVKMASGSQMSRKVGKVKKASPNKGKVNIKKNIVRPTKVRQFGRGRQAIQSGKRSFQGKNSHGKVDTYKSADFSSSISSLMSKGRATKSAKTISSSGSGIGTTSISGSESGATLAKTNISNSSGSLTGVTSGKLDSSKGVEGLVNKKGVYTAGLPYKTVILGGLDPDIIRQILIENIPRFRYCYQKVLDRSKNTFNGIVKLHFVIGASGHVTKAGVDSLSSIPGSVKGCVVNVLRRISFPAPRGGGVTEVSQPMNFYPRTK